MNETRYNDAARPIMASVNSTGFVPDYRRWGVYGLAAYRLPVLTLMPYGMVEYYNFAANPATRNDVPGCTAIYAGLNIRPTPRVTLKAQYVLGIFDEPGSTGSGRDNIAMGQAQIAWSF
jgi:N-acetyl-gamma-glutamylphosphate reductase